MTCSTSAETHARFGCGGASSGPGRSRSARRDGSTRRSRGGRRRREPPWRALWSSTCPSVGRWRHSSATRTLRGRTTTSRSARTANIAAPNYDLAHDGLSVRRARAPATEELELQLIDVRQAPPFDTFSTSLCVRPRILRPRGHRGPRAARETGRRAAAGAEGDAWLVGLGGTRAVLVEIAGRVEGAGRLRPGWARAPSLGRSGVRRIPSSTAPRRGRPTAPPDGVLLPSWSGRRGPRGRPPGAARVEISPIGEGTHRRRSGCPIARGRRRSRSAEAAAYADRDLVLRGGALRAGAVGRAARSAAKRTTWSSSIVRAPRVARWAADLRHGPNVPLRLPSLRRAVVPLRIVVPHGGVGRRTVTLDLGRTAPSRGRCRCRRAPYGVAACPPAAAVIGYGVACASGSRCSSCSPSPCRSRPAPARAGEPPSGSAPRNTLDRGEDASLRPPRGTDRWLGRFEVPAGTKALHVFASSPVDVDIELRPGASP